MLHVFCSASVGCNLSLTYAFSRELPKHRNCQGFKYLAKKKKASFIRAYASGYVSASYMIPVFTYALFSGY
ncbi:hypothetical protein BFJ63_vAg9305 [Fusarium oxysporum f. sp. narcissi]|uniref:Uncharacterized protein n=3 Tax=Fusarium oxysporum TaxID=5507 RepID=A0A420SGS2_FUSOX|nr:hypothetical protein BFJ65_g7194 [Fusarium oxysporum f. sp. cepae]RKK96550.1 hypothetical protein BFJ71_g7830 [Fusarium oxysporum]RYC87885.1 hypothetical protein BFJ63_vAg9305 [Fusarium oxysporum f. sp. narcissi]RKK57592.1 hypothetical protein BFJ67_g3348 [Fusarium oxysporum f. sp. cepae]RKL05649.1 hypothetical protein BFJ68_g10556 [Fusarium oxysporum]